MNDLDWITAELPDVGDPDGLATERARGALIDHTAAATTPTRRAPVRRRRSRTARLRVVMAGSAAVAVAGAILISAGAHHPLAQTPSSAASHRSGHGAVRIATVSPSLLKLAGDIVTAPPPPGDATLVLRDQTYPNQPSISWYDLYEDNGDYYSGETLADLSSALSDPSSADPQTGAVVTAAAAAANLSPAQAAAKIYAASPLPSGNAPSADSPAMKAALRRAKRADTALAPTVSHQAQVDNYVWMNCMHALSGGAGRADVRAGAMNALASLPDVTVTPTTYNGKPVLKVTNREFDDNYAETLLLDAQTGELVDMQGGTIGQTPSVDVIYDVTRVNAPSLTPAH